MEILNVKNTSLYENIEGLKQGMKAELFKSKKNISVQTIAHYNEYSIINSCTSPQHNKNNKNNIDSELSEQIS